MKKILSLSTAAAVLSLTAVAASAAIAPEFTNTATAGGEVVVEVKANALETPYATFTVETSENLILTGFDQGIGLFNENNKMYTFAAAAAPADGTVLLTLTFEVAAAADDEVYVTLKPTEGEVDTTAVTVTVVDAVESGEPDVTVEPTVEPTTEEPVIVEPTVEPTEDPNEGGETGENTNPPTGIALAVVPALVAGAAVVASKKRK